MNKKTLIIISIIIILLILACIFCLILSLFFMGNSKTTTNKSVTQLEYTTTTDPIALVDLSLDLENSLKLEDVRTSEISGGIIEIRTKTPENVSPDAIMGATAYIFGYIEPQFPDQIKTFRLIFTVNGLDATVLEVSRKDVKTWISKEMSDQEFVSTINKKVLI